MSRPVLTVLTVLTVGSAGISPAAGAERGGLVDAGEPGLAPGRPYAMVVDVASASRVPFFGVTRVVTRSLLRVDVERTAQGLRQRHEVCAVAVSSASTATTTIPDAFVASMGPSVYPVEFDGSAYRADPGPDTVGYAPEEGSTQVPRKANDASVLDHEGDGKPGATVRLVIPVLGTIEVYVAQYGHTRFAGELTADGRVEGQVEVVALDQRTLGASNPLFAASPPTWPLPEDSRFELRPLDEALGCDRLRAQWDGEGPGAFTVRGSGT